MNKSGVSGVAGKFRVILPVILRITFCLAMWTLGAMTTTIAEAQTRERLVAPEFSNCNLKLVSLAAGSEKLARARLD